MSSSDRATIYDSMNEVLGRCTGGPRGDRAATTAGRLVLRAADPPLDHAVPRLRDDASRPWSSSSPGCRARARRRAAHRRPRRFRPGNLSCTRPSPGWWRCSTGSSPLSGVHRGPGLQLHAVPSRTQHARRGAGAPLAEMGLPSEAEYVAAYCRRTARSASGLGVLPGLAMFRPHRHRQWHHGQGDRGHRHDVNARARGERARPLAEAGWERSLGAGGAGRWLKPSAYTGSLRRRPLQVHPKVRLSTSPRAPRPRRPARPAGREGDLHAGARRGHGRRPPARDESLPMAVAADPGVARGRPPQVGGERVAVGARQVRGSWTRGIALDRGLDAGDQPVDAFPRRSTSSSGRSPKPVVVRARSGSPGWRAPVGRPPSQSPHTGYRRAPRPLRSARW